MCKSLILLFVMLIVAGMASEAVRLDPIDAGDTTQTTLATANISEQVDVTVPANVVFNVTNISVATESASQTVSATNIVLADGKKLRIEIVSNDFMFPSTPGGSTWYCTNISWNAATWNNGTGYSGSLHDSWWSKVAESNANATFLTTIGLSLKFTLAANPSVTRAGDHILPSNSWKFSSF